jgi:hypothetical protein
MENFSKDGTGSAQWGLAGLAIFQLKQIALNIKHILN